MCMQAVSNTGRAAEKNFCLGLVKQNGVASAVKKYARYRYFPQVGIIAKYPQRIRLNGEANSGPSPRIISTVRKKKLLTPSLPIIKRVNCIAHDTLSLLLALSRIAFATIFPASPGIIT